MLLLLHSRCTPTTTTSMKCLPWLKNGGEQGLHVQVLAVLPPRVGHEVGGKCPPCHIHQSPMALMGVHGGGGWDPFLLIITFNL